MENGHSTSRVSGRTVKIETFLSAVATAGVGVLASFLASFAAGKAEHSPVSLVSLGVAVVGLGFATSLLSAFIRRRVKRSLPVDRLRLLVKERYFLSIESSPLNPGYPRKYRQNRGKSDE